MLNMHDQAVSAHPVALEAPASPLAEDWDAMMQALRQRISTIAAAPWTTQSLVQRRDRLEDCGQALAQLGIHLHRFNLTPAARQQREHELKQGAHLLACALQTGTAGTAGNRPAPAG